MKALTVKQPWASLIIEGIKIDEDILFKNIENRTWRTNYRGRVMIHAAAASWTWRKFIKYLYDIIPLLYTVFPETRLWLESLPAGKIIGSVEMVDCVINHPSIWAEKSNWYSRAEKNGVPASRGCKHERKEDNPIYNWVLANPIRFDKPIIFKGTLSFWESGIEVCQICGQPADLICASCGEYFCSKHTVRYNQFTQIDYDCCTNCAPTGPEIE